LDVAFDFGAFTLLSLASDWHRAMKLFECHFRTSAWNSQPVAMLDPIAKHVLDELLTDSQRQRPGSDALQMSTPTSAGCFQPGFGLADSAILTDKPGVGKFLCIDQP
jgi:hypothetical protein